MRRELLTKSSVIITLAGAMMMMLMAVRPATADSTIQANADTWVSDLSGQEDTNFESNVNPSTQLRNAPSVRRVSFYEFTLPQVGAHETVTGVEFYLVDYFASAETSGSVFVADFGLLNGNPDLSTIT